MEKPNNNHKSKFPKKQTLTAVLILLLTFSAMFAATQSLTVNAATGTLPAYAFITVEPNPAGVGQSVAVLIWAADPLPSATSGIGQHRTGYMVTITKPDGTIESKGPYDGDYLNTAGFAYIPTAVGNYTFKFDLPQEVIYYQWNNTNNTPLNPQNNYTSLAATATTTLVVRENSIPNFFQVPYPTQYWTRPIYGQNYWWAGISGNWLMAAWNSTSRVFDNNAAFVPEGTLASSPHILWTKEMTFGGLAGGIYGNVPYYSGMSYEMYFAPPIIIGGRVYYTTISGGEPRGQGGPFNNLGTVAIDLNTGQELFTIPNATMSFGQILNFPGVNQAGTHAYLWSSAAGVYTLFDAWSGNAVLKIANVTSGVVTFDKQGDVIIYGLANNNTFGGPGNPSQQLTMWNSTLAIESYQPSGTGTTSIDYSWRPFTTYGTFVFNTTSTNGVLYPLDGNRGIQWRVPATNVTGYSLTPFLQQGGLFDGPNILALQTGGTAGATNTTSDIGINVTAYNMQTGAIAYTSKIRPAPNLPNALAGIAAFENIWVFNGRLYNFNHYTTQWVVYDIKTGNLLWVSNPARNSWGYFGQADSMIEAYGLSIFTGFDGYVDAYNTTTGQLVWTFYGGDTPYTPYGHNTFYDGITVVDGKIILLPNEHGNGNEPLYQNLTTFIVDARTGQLVWSILGYFEKPVIADGIMLSHNNYDNTITAFGKGPSQTTVEAPLTAVNVGSTLVIQGSVTDQSVGALQIAKTVGTASIPAISDEDQKAWMEQLYMQNVGALPRTAKGVQVLLRAIDSNGIATDLGTVTTDVLGNYGITWTPTAAGLYTIVASFGGSNSYYGSFAETRVAAQTAPSAAPTGTQTPTQSATPNPVVTPTPTVTTAPPPSTFPTTTVYILAAAIVIIIVVAVVAVSLRRRK